MAHGRDLQRELAEIDLKVRQLFALVRQGIAGATEAFLASDSESARTLMARDAFVDALYFEIEELVQRQFALTSPAAYDMRYLLSMLRIVPELERSGDLCEHIAKRATRAVGDQLSPRGRGIVEQMGAVGVAMWDELGRAYVERDADCAQRLVDRDDELDRLHRSLTDELVASNPPTQIAIDAALVGRFLERLGDHATNIANRIRYIAIGTPSRQKPTSSAVSGADAGLPDRS